MGPIKNFKIENFNLKTNNFSSNKSNSNENIFRPLNRVKTKTIEKSKKNTRIYSIPKIIIAKLFKNKEGSNFISKIKRKKNTRIYSIPEINIAKLFKNKKGSNFISRAIFNPNFKNFWNEIIKLRHKKKSLMNKKDTYSQNDPSSSHRNNNNYFQLTSSQNVPSSSHSKKQNKNLPFKYYNEQENCHGNNNKGINNDSNKRNQNEASKSNKDNNIKRKIVINGREFLDRLLEQQVRRVAKSSMSKKELRKFIEKKPLRFMATCNIEVDEDSEKLINTLKKKVKNHTRGTPIDKDIELTYRKAIEFFMNKLILVDRIESDCMNVRQKRKALVSKIQNQIKTVEKIREKLN
jgi:hypothetical protein